MFWNDLFIASHCVGLSVGPKAEGVAWVGCKWKPQKVVFVRLGVLCLFVSKSRGAPEGWPDSSYKPPASAWNGIPSFVASLPPQPFEFSCPLF